MHLYRPCASATENPDKKCAIVSLSLHSLHERSSVSPHCCRLVCEGIVYHTSTAISERNSKLVHLQQVRPCDAPLHVEAPISPEHPVYCSLDLLPLISYHLQPLIYINNLNAAIVFNLNKMKMYWHEFERSLLLKPDIHRFLISANTRILICRLFCFWFVDSGQSPSKLVKQL